MDDEDSSNTGNVFVMPAARRKKEKKSRSRLLAAEIIFNIGMGQPTPPMEPLCPAIGSHEGVGQTPPRAMWLDSYYVVLSPSRLSACSGWGLGNSPNDHRQSLTLPGGGSCSCCF